MRFRPIKQFNAILAQEYFEPTISWAFRVMLALNVPLIVLPLFTGFSFNITWAAFGAYLVSLTDYRGLHYKRIVIQGIETGLIFISAMTGMLVSGSLPFSILAMFAVGMFAALVRNWSDYGSSIGVAVGFFFLFGLSYPQPFEQAIVSGSYLLVGAAWAMLITVFSFPFRPLNPVKRSVARIWKANTELLDTIIEQLVSKTPVQEEVLKKEVALRNVINESIRLFARREKTDKMKVRHYDLVLELRRSAALFSATVSTLYEELPQVSKTSLHAVQDSFLYKTLSAFAQASARLSIVIYTSRPEDMTLAKVRVKRCRVAVDLFKEAVQDLSPAPGEEAALNHFSDTLDHALRYLEQSIGFLEDKLSLTKSDYFESYKLSFRNFTSGVEHWVFSDFIKNFFRTNSEQFRYALRVSAGLCLAVFIFKYFGIDHGYWIALTMIIVIQPYYGATRKKGAERIVGTVAGVVLGGLIMLLPLSHHALVILLVFVSFFVAYFLRNNYKVGVFFVTIMMVILMQMSQRGSIELIGWRVLSTLIGAVLAVVAGYAFWPVWEKERFPALMREALFRTRIYFMRVLLYCQNELPENASWFEERRNAEAANNQAFASAQRMYEEPKHIREQVDLYFSLIGINIRLTREITSIALIMGEKKSGTIQGLKEFQSGAGLMFDHMMELISGEAPGGEIPGTKKLRAALDAASFGNSPSLYLIKTELEKIIFEMEAFLRSMQESTALTTQENKD